jgi:hypothetical protein
MSKKKRKKKFSKFEIQKAFKLIQIQAQIAALIAESFIVQSQTDPEKIKKYIKGGIVVPVRNFTLEPGEVILTPKQLKKIKGKRNEVDK